MFARDYGFLSFAKNVGKNIGENISQISQKRIDHATKSPADTLKTTSKRVIHNTAESTSDLIGNAISDRIRKVLPQNSLPQNSLEIIKNENDKEIPKERYISQDFFY